MKAVSAHELTRTRLCVEPACPNEADHGYTRCRAHQQAKPKTRGKHNPWTREDAIAALQRVGRTLGRRPSSSEIVGRGDLPSQPTYWRLFGSFGDYCVAAGFERPTGGRPKKHARLEEVAANDLGPDAAASSSTRALRTAGTRSDEAESPAAPITRTARLRVIQRIAAVREEIDAMERELLDALQDEAA